MYEWDPKKNEQNKQKHGISFEEARDSIFEGNNLLAVGIAYHRGESRHALIGKHAGKYYVGIFTIISGRIRIISVRRARDEEEKTARDRGL
jgi:uncharacterized DUF497 family protein